MSGIVIVLIASTVAMVTGIFAYIAIVASSRTKGTQSSQDAGWNGGVSSSSAHARGDGQVNDFGMDPQRTEHEPGHHGDEAGNLDVESNSGDAGGDSSGGSDAGGGDGGGGSGGD